MGTEKEEIYNDIGQKPIRGNTLYRDVHTKDMYIVKEIEGDFNLINISTQDSKLLTPPMASRLLEIVPETYFEGLRAQEQFVRERLGLEKIKLPAPSGRSLHPLCGAVGTETQFNSSEE